MFTRVLICLALFCGVAVADGSGSAAVSSLPSAADVSPVDQASFAWKLYKAGHLVPALIVAAFFILFFLERKISWLRTGYRKVAVASVLGGLGMLAERVASGTTPNTMMLMGAFGAAFTMWMKTQGEPKA
ncbi:MAG: hypothetical protein EHM89_00280 [Acidobacteria bacterium]|nr:MAG: hypothetical protein EHM89_00280 [Acidobacteriota bacterium]